MAAKTRREAGQEFLDGILAKIPADQRDAVAAAMRVDAVLDDLGDGYLRQADYTRQTADLKVQREALDKYYVDNKPVVDRAQQLLAQFPDGRVPDHLLNPDPADPAPAVDPAKLKDELAAQLSKRVEEGERGAVSFIAALTDLAQAHRDEFGERLNTQEFVKNPRVYEVGLERAYEESVAERRAAKRAADVEAKVAAAREEGKKIGVDETRAALVGTGTPPYPTPNAARNPVMAALETQRAETLANPEAHKGRPFVNRVDIGAAAEEYHRLSQTPG